MKNNYAELAEKIAYYKEFLANHQMVLDKVKEDVMEIRDKYGDGSVKNANILNNDIGI